MTNILVMKSDLSQQDIKKIIDSLIKFIVIDGKTYIAEEQLKQYTLHYLHILIQITNNELPTDSKHYTLVESILNDIKNNL